MVCREILRRDGIVTSETKPPISLGENMIRKIEGETVKKQLDTILKLKKLGVKNVNLAKRYGVSPNFITALLAAGGRNEN